MRKAIVKILKMDEILARKPGVRITEIPDGAYFVTGTPERNPPTKTDPRIFCCIHRKLNKSEDDDTFTLFKYMYYWIDSKSDVGRVTGPYNSSNNSSTWIVLNDDEFIAEEEEPCSEQ